MSKAKHQTQTWQGEFGQRYSDRNLYSLAELDAMYLERYGVSRSEMNQRFLGDLDRGLKILEVGCNVGNQLLHLQEAGFQHLSGIDLQHYALKIASTRLENRQFAQASALDLPFADNSFDLVYTAGVLIHLPPEALESALKQIHRCARRFIWGFEYCAGECTQIRYRGREDLLWKADYAKMYVSQFADLRVVDEKAFQYVGSDHVDEMFLLEKVA